MTYRELQQALRELSEYQLEMDVTVSSGPHDGESEFFRCDATETIVDSDILEENQPVILFENGWNS